MELIRFATIKLTRPAPQELGRWPYRSRDGVEVQTVKIHGDCRDITEDYASDNRAGPTIAWPYEHDVVRLAVFAVVPADLARCDSERRVRIPAGPRERAEAAIQEYADFLAVAHQCRRLIRSPEPCLAIRLDELDAQAARPSGRIAPPSHERPRARMLPILTPASTLPGAVSDRLDGLALLADSLSEESALARIRDLFRLFERAFATGPNDSIGPLTSFLRSSPYPVGYELDEVKYWMQSLRPEVTHADRREAYARSPEVEPYLGRIEWAAYDVLLNKKDWRSRRPERREAVSFRAGVSPDRSGVTIFNPGATILVDWMDPFDVFPRDWGSRLSVGPPWIPLGNDAPGEAPRSHAVGTQ